MEYIYLLRQALVYLTVIFWIYELAISLCSLIKFKEKPLIKKYPRNIKYLGEKIVWYLSGKS